MNNMYNKESSYPREKLGFQLDLFYEFNWLSKLAVIQSSLTAGELMERLQNDTGEEPLIFGKPDYTFAGKIGQHSFRLRRTPSRQSPWIEGRVIPEASGCRVELYVGWPWWMLLILLLFPLLFVILDYYQGKFQEFSLLRLVPLFAPLMILRSFKQLIASTLEFMEQYVEAS